MATMGRALGPREAHPSAKLTADEVLGIREALKQGEAVKALARHYEVCPKHIRDIRQRKWWKHLPE